MKLKLLVLALLFPPICFASKEVQSVKVEELAKTSESWDGSALPPYPKGDPEVTILKITVQPGVELPWHTHPIVSAAVMLEGELTVLTRDGKERRLTAGDALVEVVGKIHRGINQGNEPVVIIVFYAGTVGQTVTHNTE